MQLARQMLEASVRGDTLPAIHLTDLSPALRQKGATFVTLTQFGHLRGCIGALEPYQPLVQDVCEHTIAAALNDYRFNPVQPAELAEIEIEISCITPPQPLDYTDPQNLLAKLRPGLDGLTLKDITGHRATFLPQVWLQLPEKTEFLNHLCQKMGLPAKTWRTQHLQAQTYQVENFHE